MEIAGLTLGSNDLVARTSTTSEYFLGAVKNAKITLHSAKCWHQGPDWSIERRTGPNTWIFAPLTGSIIFIAAGGTWTVKPGQLCVVPAHLPHQAHFAPGCLAWDSVSIRLSMRDPFGADLLDWPAPWVVPVAPDCCRRLVDLVGLSHRDESLAQWWLGHLLIEILTAPLNNVPVLTSGLAADPLVASAMALLEQEPGLRIHSLARRLRIGPSRFRARFMRAAGCSPKTWQLTRLLDRAADRIARGHETIAAVAHDLGFANPHWFQRRFRQHHGCTPSQWRERHRGGM